MRFIERVGIKLMKSIINYDDMMDPVLMQIYPLTDEFNLEGGKNEELESKIYDKCIDMTSIISGVYDSIALNR